MCSVILLEQLLTGQGNVSTQLIGALDGNGNLLSGKLYADKLKSGLLSLSRIQPNTFKLQYIRTQVGKIDSRTCWHTYKSCRPLDQMTCWLFFYFAGF